MCIIYDEQLKAFSFRSTIGLFDCCKHSCNKLSHVNAKMIVCEEKHFEDCLRGILI